MKPIVMAGPWITDHEIKMVDDAMRTGWYEKPYYYVETFQAEFAKYHNRKYALMTPNCTTALHLLLLGLGVGKGDEVLVPDCTWIGSTACISYVGATPVFCDIEADSWCIDPASVKKNITTKTKAIIVVDLYGNMPKMDELKKIADDHGIYLIEDAAEAVGSTYKGVRAGKFGVGSTFSFHRTKTICTGEGGMLLIDDDKLFEKCSMYRDHGRKKGGPMYYNFEVTPKYMPFNVQAAMGYAQFQRIDELVKKKHWIYEMYKQRLASVLDIQLNEEPSHVYNGVWITAVVFGKSHKLNKADAISKLEKLGIPSRPFFYPLSSLPAYGSKETLYKLKNPVAYDISSRAINLSCAMNLDEVQIDFICTGICKIIQQQ